MQRGGIQLAYVHIVSCSPQEKSEDLYNYLCCTLAKWNLRIGLNIRGSETLS